VNTHRDDFTSKMLDKMAEECDKMMNHFQVIKLWKSNEVSNHLLM